MDTYSPAAIENAPASRPATPASRITERSAPEPANPSTSAALDTSPSLTPNTAARSVPERSPRCRCSRPGDAGPRVGPGPWISAATVRAWPRSSAAIDAAASGSLSYRPASAAPPARQRQHRPDRPPPGHAGPTRGCGPRRASGPAPARRPRAVCPPSARHDDVRRRPAARARSRRSPVSAAASRSYRAAASRPRPAWPANAGPDPRRSPTRSIQDGFAPSSTRSGNANDRTGGSCRPAVLRPTARVQPARTAGGVDSV